MVNSNPDEFPKCCDHEKHNAVCYDEDGADGPGMYMYYLEYNESAYDRLNFCPWCGARW